MSRPAAVFALFIDKPAIRWTNSIYGVHRAPRKNLSTPSYRTVKMHTFRYSQFKSSFPRPDLLHHYCLSRLTPTFSTTIACHVCNPLLMFAKPIRNDQSNQQPSSQSPPLQITRNLQSVNNSARRSTSQWPEKDCQAEYGEC